LFTFVQISFTFYISTVQQSESARLDFSEFKTASQAINSNDEDIELLVATESSEQALQGSEEVKPLEGSTVALKSSVDQTSSKPDLNSSESSLSATTTSATTEALEFTTTVDNKMASQLSTAQQQQQPEQKQLKKETEAVKELVKDEDCNSDLNPNCMPATTLASSDIATEPEEQTMIQQLLSSSLEVVTSSILEASEGFCSEEDADCSLKPTAAMLTQHDQVTFCDILRHFEFFCYTLSCY
jgi:hypothetical protein